MINSGRPQSAIAGEAIRAVTRLLSAAVTSDAPGTVERALVREARGFSGADSALLLRVKEDARSFTVVAGDPEPLPRTAAPLAALPSISDALISELPLRLAGEQARRAAAAVGIRGLPPSVMLIAARPAGGVGYVLLLATADEAGFDRDAADAAGAFASAAGASLVQADLRDRSARQVARQSALARAAKALNESLDLARVLPRICEEAAAILGADAVAVYRGSAGGSLVLEAMHPATGDPAAGTEAQSSLVLQALASGRAVGVDVYDSPPNDTPLQGVRSALAAPMRWDGEGRGALWVGFHGEHHAGPQDIELLASFAELAAVACRNASVQAGLAEAARTDGLTGCLNHAALHETLRREMQRSRRTGRRLALVLVDLDHFKQVNERQGHLVGDEVLRRVGRALRQAVRPYDFVARYGGDEFAVVAVDAHEERAAEMGERAIERVGAALVEVLGSDGGSHATAGVAEWKNGSPPSDLVREADRALLYGKQEGVRGSAIRASTVPDDFMLGRALDDDRPPEATTARDWPSEVRRATEPLRKRNRQLGVANALGARIAQMTSADEIAEAAVDELQREFGYPLCAVVRLARGRLDVRAVSGDPARVGATNVVERSLVERRPVLGGARRGGSPGAEAAVPIWAGTELWGALDVQHDDAEEFDEADVRLLQTVADQLGAALRSASLYEQLERAYLGTAEVLGAAFEARGAGVPEQTRSIVVNADRVGRQLGMSEDELRVLRYAAAFHDIGKVSVPEAILNKSGPLTESERDEVARHPVVAEQILGPVEFLEQVRPLVRHCFERWDGGGYPDGLAGDEIPLGARVIHVCDAHDAMTRDRPYRAALPESAAREEIQIYAGAQFDARVAAVFLETSEREEQGARS
jgi:diguanylate cyclase (GGDEF)-like protein